MKITFEGREWDFDLEAIDIKQAVAMHLAYQFTLDGWMDALKETDPRALQCLWWLMLQQDGQVMPLKDANAPLIALSVAFADAIMDEKENEGAESGPDPTSPPSPPGGPPSPEPATRTATTRTPRARPGGGRPTVSTPAI